MSVLFGTLSSIYHVEPIMKCGCDRSRCMQWLQQLVLVISFGMSFALAAASVADIMSKHTTTIYRWRALTVAQFAWNAILFVIYAVVTYKYAPKAFRALQATPATTSGKVSAAQEAAHKLISKLDDSLTEQFSSISYSFISVLYTTYYFAMTIASAFTMSFAVFIYHNVMTDQSPGYVDTFDQDYSDSLYMSYPKQVKFLMETLLVVSGIANVVMAFPIIVATALNPAKHAPAV